MGIGRQALIVTGYLCYALALFALFAYLKFPSQQVRALVLTTLRHNGLEQIRIGSVAPLLPAGLTFSEVSVARDFDGQAVELMRLPELQVQLQTLRPFANPVRIGFEGGFYGGTLLGALEWESNGKGPNLGIRVEPKRYLSGGASARSETCKSYRGRQARRQYDFTTLQRGLAEWAWPSHYSG